MTTVKKFLLAISGLAFMGGIALADQGQFGYYPTVGKGATSAGTTVDGNTSSGTIPAGPGTLPGTAYFPADTGLAQGQTPQTVIVPAVLTGSTVQHAAPLTATTVTLGTGIAKLVLNPAATIAALTVTLPPATALIDGQTLVIASSQTVTALTVTAGTGTTVVPTITTVTSAAPVRLIYNATTLSWVTA